MGADYSFRRATPLANRFARSGAYNDPGLFTLPDGTSVFAERLLSGWKSGEIPAELFASSLAWSGPLPGDGVVSVPSRPPLSIAVYSAGSPAPDVSTPADAFRASLTGLREP